MTVVARFSRWLLWLLLTGSLAGCALRPVAPSTDLREVPVQQWAAISAPESWQLRGRAALAIGEEGGAANIIWRESATAYRIDLRGTLGAGSLRLQGDAAGVVLTTASGERYTAEDARALLTQVSGYDLPLEYLRHWLLGQPVPELSGSVFVDQQGRIRQIEQAGWDVLLTDYQTQASFSLPGQVTATGRGVRLNFLIRDWAVGR